MDRMPTVGGTPLRGRISIGGAKNAALPLMAACLLTEETLILDNVPRLADIDTMKRLLAQHGVTVDSQDDPIGGGEQTLHLNAGRIGNTTAPYDLVRKMRASVLVLGPLLARFGEARVSLPGGWALGDRPVALHLAGLAEIGSASSREIDRQYG